MDLPERVLHHRVGSRLGLTRLVFQAYTHDQLANIVRNRLQESNMFVVRLPSFNYFTPVTQLNTSITQINRRKLVPGIYKDMITQGGFT